MILTKEAILKEIQDKKIIINPFNKKNIGPASIDLTLDKPLRIFDKDIKKIGKDIDYKKITKLVINNQGYFLRPKELILGITKEKITLPENICGWLNSRSRFARIGLMSHITAPFIAPGISNKQVLEIYNASNNIIKLMPGERICQIIFQRCEGKAKYKGIFKNQSL